MRQVKRFDFGRSAACDVERLEPRRLCSHFVNGSHTYVDHTFADANWTLTAFPLGAGGVTSANQQPKGGHGGKYRQVIDTVYAGGAGSELLGFHANDKAVYDPAKGAITSVNYAEDDRLLSGFGEGEGAGAALEHNGIVYFAIGRTVFTPQALWKRQTITNLTAADFVTVDGGSNPDFSQNAAPIEFGFFRENSPGASAGYTIVGGIDNWQLKIKTRKQV